MSNDTGYALVQIRNYFYTVKLIDTYTGRVKSKTIKLVFVAFPQSTQHFKEKEQKLVGSESE
jgi:hypothetical protein